MPGSLTSIGAYAFANCTNLATIVIPDGLSNIGYGAFRGCASLARLTFPANLTNIEDYAFFGCTNLSGVYCSGSAPSFQPISFYLNRKAKFYYLPGTTGWGTTFAGLPSALWKPAVSAGDPTFGVRSNQFGFTINWASDKSIIVETANNLLNPEWTPLSTNILTSGSSYFSDPKWTNAPTRLYRLRAP